MRNRALALFLALPLTALALVGCAEPGDSSPKADVIVLDGAATADSGGGLDGTGSPDASPGTPDSVPDPTPDASEPPPVEACAPAPASMPEQAAAALELANGYRAAMGIACATLDEAINLAAQNHCDYHTANSGSCLDPNPHKEVDADPPCENFTGVSFWERMSAAGYEGNSVFENMAFSNDGASATQQWIDSVWHRTPVLSPWVRHFGYGGAPGCDTMDFGRGPQTPNDVVAVYPYDGQVDVPVNFFGQYEGPEPPKPPTGWPSGYVIHIYAKNLTITEHVITVDGDAAPIEHIWITPGDSQFLSSEHVMYPHAPMQPNTTYRVQITGTHDGSPMNLDWTFTTK